MAKNEMSQVDFWIRYFKEHTNTIGCVELDGLDCREVLALLQELADKKVDKPNKMEAVAQLFGKELDEQFYIVIYKKKYIARFTVFGLSVLDESANPCEWDLGHSGLLEDLLTGSAVIIDE